MFTVKGGWGWLQRGGDTAAGAGVCGIADGEPALVEIAEKLLERKILVPHGAQFYRVTDIGTSWFCGLGIDTAALEGKGTEPAKRCLDWIERRHHIAGPLGLALFRKFLSLNWMIKMRNSHAMRITDQGRTELERLLGISLIHLKR